MNPEVKERWLSALRSGDYSQARGQLKNQLGYCCLGVLCDLHAVATGGAWNGVNYLHHGCSLPVAVQDWAGLDDDDPMVGQCRASYWNDKVNYSFYNIAYLIDEYL